MSSTPWDMLVKGSPFARSCTIYRGNSILAQVPKSFSVFHIPFVLQLYMCPEFTCVSKGLIETPKDSGFVSRGCGSQAWKRMVPDIDVTDVLIPVGFCIFFFLESNFSFSHECFAFVITGFRDYRKVTSKRHHMNTSGKWHGLGYLYSYHCGDARTGISRNLMKRKPNWHVIKRSNFDMINYM